MICFEFKTGYAIIGRYVIVFAVSNLYTCIMILVIYIITSQVIITEYELLMFTGVYWCCCSIYFTIIPNILGPGKKTALALALTNAVFRLE